MVRTKGFALLAARPAPPLSMASFAVKYYVSNTYVGKAFSSRKTAPTLKSLRVVGSYQKEKHQNRCFSVWCGRRDLNPHGVTHRNLKPARLPISPRPHIWEIAYISAISSFSIFLSFTVSFHALPPLDILPTISPFSITIAALSSIPKALS